MDKKTEALKLALEALESCGWNDGYAGENQYFHDDLVDKAIAYLREALAEQPAQQQEPVIDHSCKDTYELIMKWADIYASQTGCIYSEAAQDPSKTARMADERTILACVVAQALSQPAQPQQEPVNSPRLCRDCADFGPICPNSGKPCSEPQPAQPQQEPVAWMTQARCFVDLSEFTEAEARLFGWKPVYTSPPQRKPLTEEQIFRLPFKFRHERPLASSIRAIARAIEAAHGIKENA